MANKLELTWYGKEDKISVEPRLLIENKELSNTEYDENTENILIHGDNLLALKALEKKYAGQVKCIYIDPPFNTGKAFEHYDDNLEHSIWLNLMHTRFKLLHKLLSNEGVIFVNLDDSEAAYCKVLMDEIFGRSNYLNEIIVSTNESFGFKSTSDMIFKQANHILFYAKNRSEFEIDKASLLIEREYDTQYKWVFFNTEAEESDWYWENINTVVARENGFESSKAAKKELHDSFDIMVANYAIENAERVFRTASVSGGALLKRKETIAISKGLKNKIVRHPDDDMDYMFIGGERVIYYRERLSELDGQLLPAKLVTDIWLDISVEGLASEGGVSFPKGKKPEKLLRRCIEMSTKPGDIVLDSFLGSGTTAAVAHKMNRRWIGVEMGNQAYTHSKIRLDSIIAGAERSGITKSVDWQGGGGYRFYELAPTLINTDAFGEPIINKDYSPEMLASAVALHEGFEFYPSEEYFWKQSRGNEKSFLFVTTRHIDVNFLAGIHESMEDDEFLIIACKSYDQKAEYQFSNIKVKKIPQMLLEKCEFGKDDYNLNIVNPPIYEDYGEEDCDE